MVGVYAMQTQEEQESAEKNQNPVRKCTLRRVAIALTLVCVLVLIIFAIAYLTQKARSEDESCDGDEALLFLEHNAGYKEDDMLPEDVVPHHYNLTLQLFMPPEYNFTTKGHVEVFIECIKETKVIVLHSHDLVIDTVNVTSENVSSDSPHIESVSQEKELVHIHLNETLHAQSRYILDITFRGVINNISVGLYRSSYLSEDGNISWIASTQFEPSDARRMFPCFDEPRMKSTFILKLILQKGTSSLSNMPKEKTELLDADWELVSYMQTPRMSTYLLAFTAGELKPYTDDKQQNIQIWSRGDMARYGEWAQEIAPKMFKLQEEYIGVPYRMPKLDLISVPSFLYAGMENWGLIVFDETALLYNPETSSLSDKISVTIVIAHELSHQWFGDLVTPEWWDNIWLNEGFATYYEYLTVDLFQPLWKINHMFISAIFNLMEIDSLLTTRAMISPIHADETPDCLDTISYIKGGATLRMLHHFLGDEDFRMGIKNYLLQYSYNSTTQNKLWQNLNLWNKNDIGVKEVMNTWTNQSGYPVVKFARYYENGTALVTQKPFVLELDCHEFNIADDRLWSVPVTYTHGDELDWSSTKPNFWLTTKSDILTNLPDENIWIIANIQHVGYYRVNYDTDNWNLLREQLLNNHTAIDVINRAQILNDVLTLARSDEVEYSTALNITKYLFLEEENLPWQAALSSFSYLDKMLTGTPAHDAFKDYILNMTSSLYKRFGWSSKQADDDIQSILLRQSILSWNCKYDNPDCKEKVNTMFDNWKLQPNNNNTLTSNDKAFVLCTGIARGSEDDWKLIWKMYTKTNFKQEKTVLLQSLACTNETRLLQRLLTEAMNSSSGIDLSDGNNVFASVAQNSKGRKIIYDFLKNNMDQFSSRFKDSSTRAVSIIDQVTGSYKTKDEINKLKILVKENQTPVKSILNGLKSALYRSKNNLRWMNTKYQQVYNWLQENKLNC